MSRHASLLGLDRGGEPSRSCLRSSACARRRASSYLSARAASAALEGVLPQFQVVRCLPLSIVTVDGRVLVLKVKQEPEFYTWVRDADVDAGGRGELQRPGHVGMLIDIKDAPVFAISVTAAAPRRLEISRAPHGSLLDERQRRSVEVVNGDDDPLSVRPAPVREVDRLGLLAFCEDKDRMSLGRIGDSSLRLTAAFGAHPGLPVALSATSANSSAERIGVAPYLPARYLRPIASSLRGLRSDSAYSLLAPSLLFSVNHT